MISKVITSYLQDVSDRFGKYGLNINVQYNSDLDMISQYTQSISLRSMFAKDELDLISQEELERLNKDSYILMMYNYSPLRRVVDRLNNINFEAVLDDNKSAWLDLQRKEPQLASEVEHLQKIREEAAGDPTTYQIRDMLYGEISFTHKILTTDTQIMNNIQFLYVQKLQRNQPFNLEVTLGKGLEPIELEYMTKFEDIDSIGHIDYQRYGNLLHVTFNSTIQGPFFSNYTKTVPKLNKIDLSINIV